MPKGLLNITGDVQYFDKNGDSGDLVRWGFCPTCGAQIFGKSEIVAGVLGIRAGSFDNPELYQTTMDVYKSSSNSWDCMNPDLPKFQKLPAKK